MNTLSPRLHDSIDMDFPGSFTIQAISTPPSRDGWRTIFVVIDARNTALNAVATVTVTNDDCSVRATVDVVGGPNVTANIPINSDNRLATARANSISCALRAAGLDNVIAATLNAIA